MAVLLTIYTTTKESAVGNCPAMASSQLASLSYSRSKKPFKEMSQDIRTGRST